MSERIEPWEIEKRINEVVDKWKPAVGEVGLENADMIIKKLKPITKVCEDCGRTVTDRRTRINMCKNHIREFCEVSDCQRYRHPDTGKFEIEKYSAETFFRSRYKSRHKY